MKNVIRYCFFTPAVLLVGAADGVGHRAAAVGAGVELAARGAAGTLRLLVGAHLVVSLDGLLRRNCQSRAYQFGRGGGRRRR